MKYFSMSARFEMLHDKHNALFYFLVSCILTSSSNGMSFKDEINGF